MEPDARGTSLSEGIFLSLKYLEVEFKKWKASKAVDVERSMSELYTSLCCVVESSLGSSLRVKSDVEG